MDNTDRRKKYTKQPKQDQGLRFTFDITIMSAFCSYVVSENTSVHTSCLANLYTILNSIPESLFGDNQSLVVRFRFCKEALKTRLEKKITRKEFIIRDVIGPLGNKFEGLDVENLAELSNTEIMWLEKDISSIMDVMFINNNIVDLARECSDFVESDYTDKMKCVETIKDRVVKMNNEFRRHDLDMDSEDTMFKLSNPEGSIQKILDRMNSPSYKLVTGMQSFNQIIAGGFEGSRVYCFYGLPGEGKTTTLLNLLYQLKKYNGNYVCKDRTKKPCIVLLTMENQIHETVCTLYNIACSNDDIKSHSTQEIMDIMSQTGLAVTPESPIDIVIKYKPINSVDTNYLFKLTEDLEDDGYEVICLLQDYVKRIRPVEDNNKDERFRLGAVINDFKNYAVAKDIPVITASQINRDGARIVDDSRNSNRPDIIKKIGRVNIGESSLIDENLDASIFLLPEWDIAGNKYMGFKLTKRRFKADTSVTADIFYQPFVDGNIVKLEEDYGCARPASKRTLTKGQNAIVVRSSFNASNPNGNEVENKENSYFTSGEPKKHEERFGNMAKADEEGIDSGSEKAETVLGADAIVFEEDEDLVNQQIASTSFKSNEEYKKMLEAQSSSQEDLIDVFGFIRD